MTAQDIISLAIGYAIFCVGVFAFVIFTFRKIAGAQGVSLREMPAWMVASIFGLSVCPLLNVVMLVNTIRLKSE